MNQAVDTVLDTNTAVGTEENISLIWGYRGCRSAPSLVLRGGTLRGLGAYSESNGWTSSLGARLRTSPSPGCQFVDFFGDPLFISLYLFRQLSTFLDNEDRGNGRKRTTLVSGLGVYACLEYLPCSEDNIATKLLKVRCEMT